MLLALLPGCALLAPGPRPEEAPAPVADAPPAAADAPTREGIEEETLEPGPADAGVDGAQKTGAAPEEAAPISISLLPTIQADTPTQVAAATRLVDAARGDLAGGDPPAALDKLERAIGIDPNNAYAYYFLAEAHLQRRSYDQAIAFAAKAANLAARTAPDWMSRCNELRGRTYEAAGRFADARQAYARALQLDPNSRAAADGLARLGGQTGAAP